MSSGILASPDFWEFSIRFLREVVEMHYSDVTMQICTHAQDEQKRKALEKFEARLVQ